MRTKRVVITGIGQVSPIGIGWKEHVDALKSGKSGIGAITRFPTDGFDVRIAGEVKKFEPQDFDITKKDARHLELFSQYALAATKIALNQSQLHPDKLSRFNERAGVYMGVGLGGLPSIETNKIILFEKGPKRITPFLIPKIVPNMASGIVSIHYCLKGPSLTYTTACAASSHAVGEAFRAVREGRLDLAIAGGAESVVSPLAISGFAKMDTLSKGNENPQRASKPFDIKRDGFVLSEGASVLVLESLGSAIKRDVPILGEIVGYGASSDAYHITSPDPEGVGMLRAMQMALEDAGLSLDEIEYINAHGTSTKYNDLAETLALKKLFGEYVYKIPVSSTKSMTGHLLGASGAFEAAICAIILQESFIPPTINLEESDEACDLDYVPNIYREASPGVIMTNSFGFGGTNSSLIIKRVIC